MTGFPPSSPSRGPELDVMSFSTALSSDPPYGMAAAFANLFASQGG